MGGFVGRFAAVRLSSQLACRISSLPCARSLLVPNRALVVTVYNLPCNLSLAYCLSVLVKPTVAMSIASRLEALSQ